MNSLIAGLSVTTSVLLSAGFDRLSPAEGAFYLLADVSGRTNDSVAFCARMPAEVGVATTPGSILTVRAATGCCGSAIAGRRRIGARRPSGSPAGGSKVARIVRRCARTGVSQHRTVRR
jgi:hypothetical protein